MRTHFVRLALLAPFLLLPTPRPAAAQSSAPMPGTLVRIHVPSVSPVPLTGTLLEGNDRELVLFQPASGRKTIPIDTITRLQWSEGRHNKAGTFAKWGAIGMGGLMAITFAAGASEFGDYFCKSRGGCAVLGATMGGISGAMYGALIGVAVRTYDWKEVRLTKVAAASRPQVTLKWRF